MENKLYADMHGDGQTQPSQDPPQYTSPAALQQPGPPPGYPPNPSTMAGAPYYAPPSGAGYGGGYGYQPPAPPQQQQQQVTVISAPASMPTPVVYMAETFSGAINYSCFVLWCCNFIFGLIGWVLASMARDSAVSDPQGARKLGRASYIVSTVGIIVSVVVVIVVFVVVFDENCHGYKYDGVCYRHRSFGDTAEECWDKNGVIDGDYCYYN